VLAGVEQHLCLCTYTHFVKVQCVVVLTCHWIPLVHAFLGVGQDSFEIWIVKCAMNRNVTMFVIGCHD
jgi:hypothetical protein